jgi:hypothetical protein
MYTEREPKSQRTSGRGNQLSNTMTAAERVLPERVYSHKKSTPASWRAQKVSYSVGGGAKNTKLRQFRSPVSAPEP